MPDQIKVEFDVDARMRDGTILRANIFRPEGPGNYPVLLSRTPYGKDFASVNPWYDGPRLARAGYIVIIQDVRGRFRSEGDWRPFEYEAQDGYDTVEWAAALPGSTGSVGMFGVSYFGFTQWAAASQNPPHLKAIMPGITWSDFRDGGAWRDGALELGLLGYWHLNALSLDTILRRHAEAPLQQKFGAIVATVREIDNLREEGYYSLPLKDFEPLKKLGVALENLEELVSRPNDPAVSHPFSIGARYETVQVPSLNIGGWYDIFTQGVIDNYLGTRAKAGTEEGRQSKLMMGPWSHVNYSNTVGDVDFGFASGMTLMNLQTDMTGLMTRWFDYWLKGTENGIMQEPPVKIFVMGDNAWRDEQEWPLARTVYTPYYLHSIGEGNGLLSAEQPGQEAPDEFVYDPANPVPTLGGNVLMNMLYGPGVKDQRVIEERADVLCYTSEPLSQDLEVTGPVAVRLWAATDGPDTDFVARLVDVHPDGFAQNLCDGIIRARYRHGHEEEFLEPGQVYELTIDLWSTSNVFKAGHRVRLDITSSCFPRWDRNHNTGELFGHSTDLRPARQQIFHDAEHPSHILLPVIPR